jgi:hypothetical protein
MSSNTPLNYLGRPGICELGTVFDPDVSSLMVPPDREVPMSLRSTLPLLTSAPKHELKTECFTSEATFAA